MLYFLGGLYLNDFDLFDCYFDLFVSYLCVSVSDWSVLIGVLDVC